jgi:hypothetical protein
MLHNKPKAEVHLGHLLTGPKEEEQYSIPLYFRYAVLPIHSLLYIK